MTVYEGVAWMGNQIAKTAERRARRRVARKGIGPALQIGGLAALDYAAWSWIPVVGIVAVGLSLLLIGEQVKGGDA